MELKYKLDKISMVIDADKETMTYTFKPTLEPWHNKCTFTVRTTAPDEDMKLLDLPHIINDVIVMEFKPKNVQKDLKSK